MDKLQICMFLCLKIIMFFFFHLKIISVCKIMYIVVTFVCMFYLPVRIEELIPTFN